MCWENGTGLVFNPKQWFKNRTQKSPGILKKNSDSQASLQRNHIRIHGGGNQESGVVDFSGDCHEQPCQRPPNPWRITFTHVTILCLWDFPGKNTWVGSHSLLQGSSWPRGWTRVSCIAGRFFTVWATRETQVTTSVSVNSVHLVFAAILTWHSESFFDYPEDISGS